MDAPNTQILAWDEAWLYGQEGIEIVWSPMGQTPVLRQDTQRYRLAFYGALNLRTGEEHAIMTDKLNQRTSVTFLQYLLDLYPQQPLLLIGDRASWHQGAPLAALLQAHPRLELYALPVACPELNPQEHVWSAARRLVHQSPSLRFHERVTHFLHTLRATSFRSNLIDRYVPSIVPFLNV
jgi:transposase